MTAATSPPEHHRVDADDLGREELERLLKELEGEGWTGRTVMLAVMPRLFDLLDADELDATAAGLRENGVPEAELAVLMPRAAEAGEIDPYLPFEDVRPIDARRKLDPGSVEFVFGPHSIALSGYSQRSPVPFDPDHHLFQVDQLARGLAELRDGRPDAAQIHFRRAAYLELNTSGADAALLGGLALCAAGRPADAITLMSHHNPTDDIGYWYGLLEDLGDDVSPDLETLRIGVTPGLTVEMPPSAQAIAWALVGAAHATGRWFVAARWLAALVEADFEAGEMALPLLDALPDSPDVLRALVMPLSGLGIQRSTLDEKARGRLAVRPSMSRHRRT